MPSSSTSVASSAPWALRGGVAVITGAAGGIGAALARALAAEGMHLALVDRNADSLATVAADARASGVTVSTHVLDVQDVAGCAALPAAVLAAHGRVTVLVNNAGVALGGRFDQVSAADFDWLMDINFQAPVRLTRAFLPWLSQQPAALLVQVSSIFGIVAPPGQTAYCASKFALRGFSESLRHELAEAGSGVRVTLVHPGGVRTGIAAQARVPDGAPPDDVAREQAAWNRLLVLTPEAAARRIVQGMRVREARVLVGRDAEQATWVQRIFPVRYWALMARDIARRVGRAA